MRYTHQIHFVYNGKEFQTSVTSYNRLPSDSALARIDGIVTKIHTIPHY